VQAVNYSVIIYCQNKVQKPTISQIESVYYHGASLENFESLKVSASVSEAATSRLGVVSDKILNVSGLVSVSP